MKVLFRVAAVAGALIPSVGMAAAQADAAPTAASASAQTEIAAGAVIYDPQGGEVGKVDSVSGDNVVIDTGTNKATLPKSAFGEGVKGPTISATKAEIDAAVAASLAQANAARDAALIVGTEVRGSGGTPIGTIKEVTADQVVVNRPTGLVSLNKSLFASEGGSVVLRLTAAELDAAAQAAAAPADTTATATATQGESTAPTQTATPDEAAASAPATADETAAPQGGGAQPRR